MAMTPTQEAQYALNWGLDPAHLKSEVRAEYDRLKPEHDRLKAEGAARPQAATAASKPAAARAEDAMRGFLFDHWLKVGGGVAVLVIGIIMQVATSSRVALCNSFVGQLGQSFSTQANADCSVANGVHGLGVAFTWIGVLGLVGAGIYLWMAYQKVGQVRTVIARQTQQAAETTEPEDVH